MMVHWWQKAVAGGAEIAPDAIAGRAPGNTPKP
jgi:hypothetical protein